MEGYFALKKNHIRGAFFITVIRNCRVITQFMFKNNLDMMSS